MLIEKELVQELDSLKGSKRSTSGGRNGTKVVNAKGKTVSGGGSMSAKLDSYIKNIETERDYLKQEVDTLNKLLKATNGSSVRAIISSGVSLSPSRKSRKDSTSKARSQSPSKTRCTVCSASTNGNARSGSKSPSPSRKGNFKSPSRGTENELIKMTRERDELRALMDKFERHMAEVKIEKIKN